MTECSLFVCNIVLFAAWYRDDKHADVVDLSDEVSELKSNLHRLKSEVQCALLIVGLRFHKYQFNMLPVNFRCRKVTAHPLGNSRIISILFLSQWYAESGFLRGFICSARWLLQNAELLEEARSARIYKDELDIFREKVCEHFLRATGWGCSVHWPRYPLKPGFHYPSWGRPVNSASGNARPSTRPVLTGNGNRSPVNSGR